jgi:PIN domain nuclease of toxin-antitoxin system
MAYLLDTHILIWLPDEPEQLSQTSHSIINDRDEECYVSIASLWEIAIKFNLKKLELKIAFEDIQNKLEEYNIKILQIHYSHLQQYVQLPLLHKDPFDRISIAQALSNSIAIISKDGLITQYNVQTIW